MSFRITWLGQGGYIFEVGKKMICVDPYLSNSVEKAEGLARLVPIPVKPEELKADIILVTHNHIDHLDRDTLVYTDKQSILYAGPDSCIEEFRKMGIPERNLTVLNRGQSMTCGDAVISAVHAEHTKDSIGVVISHDGVTLYLTGDSLYSEKLAEAVKHEPDILICCINGKLGNMDYNDAAKLAGQLGVKVAVPCHYGMFAKNTEDPLNYKTALENYKARYMELELNKPYEAAIMLK
jgi:L-ascorbate 6-phosphate lactonase